MKSVYAEQYRQIGLKIAYYRKLRGLTQEELAEQVGLTLRISATWRHPISPKRCLWTLCLTSPQRWMWRRKSF